MNTEESKCRSEVSKNGICATKCTKGFASCHRGGGIWYTYLCSEDHWYSGAIACNELHGSQDLTLRELISAANKTIMFLFSRGCKEDAARAFFKVSDENSYVNMNTNPQVFVLRYFITLVPTLIPCILTFHIPLTMYFIIQYHLMVINFRKLVRIKHCRDCPGNIYCK